MTRARHTTGNIQLTDGIPGMSFSIGCSSIMADMNQRNSLVRSRSVHTL
ncbi:hypothetical protein [Paraprevotella clara]|nr:hypothetical protein [Paraprevotella clara]